MRATTIMSSLSESRRREAYKGIKEFCKLRLQGDLSENEIAKELGFRSTEAMRIQLNNWGLSNLMVAPDAGEKRRKAQDSGDVERLPAAGQAERLFRADLDLLTYYLNQLPELREHRQGKLHVSSSWVGEDWEEYRRDEYTEEGWKEVCEEFDEDAAQEAFRVPISPYVHRGAGPTPWEGLTLLIALHALMNEKVDHLISALHDYPTSVNLAELHKRKGKEGAKQDGVVTELKKSAAKLAVTVRGGEVRSGQKSGEVFPSEMTIALTVKRLTKEGLSREEIHRELKEQRLLDEKGRYWVQPKHEEFACKEKYTIDDVKRHQELDLSPPS